jgi:hypothetical protein
MKLLFDQNLSFKLCTLLSDLFPDAKPVRELGLDQSDDRIVWQHTKDNGVHESSSPNISLSPAAEAFRYFILERGEAFLAAQFATNREKKCGVKR